MHPLRLTITELTRSDGDQLSWPLDNPNYACLMRASALTTEQRCVAVRVSSGKTAFVYPLVLRAFGNGWLARTPEYGGPWELDGQPALSPAQWAEARLLIDRALIELRVVSEVFTLSPWLPSLNAVASAWSCVKARDVCIASTKNRQQRWIALSKGRRSDITRDQRSSAFQWKRYEHEDADLFSAGYEGAMRRIGAERRFRFEPPYFHHIASTCADHLWLAVSQEDQGYAAALFHMSASRAQYHLAYREGERMGLSGLLWLAEGQLADLGVTELLLGGGVTDSPTDGLFRFKRGQADYLAGLFIGARCYDPTAQAQAVKAGAARDLPGNAVTIDHF